MIRFTTNFIRSEKSIRHDFQTLTSNDAMEFPERSSHLRSGLHAGHQVIMGTAIVHQDHRLLVMTTRSPAGYVPGDECLLRAGLCKVQLGSCFSPDYVLLDLW